MQAMQGMMAIRGRHLMIGSLKGRPELCNQLSRGRVSLHGGVSFGGGRHLYERAWASSKFHRDGLYCAFCIGIALLSFQSSCISSRSELHLLTFELVLASAFLKKIMDSS